jgi:hypothetical protein
MDIAAQAIGPAADRRRLGQPLPVVVELPQCSIAAQAQQATPVAGVVAMVHMERLAHGFGGAADGAAAALGRQRGLVVSQRDAVLALQVRVAERLL